MADDVPVLDDDTTEQDTNAQGAPLIQISHMHVTSNAKLSGAENLGYEDDDDIDDASVYSLSRPVSPESNVNARRKSYMEKEVTSCLAVPDSGAVRRRHSMGCETRALTESPPPPPDDAGDLDMWNHVTKAGGGAMETLSVDHLMTSHQTPKSPGCRSARSLCSEWSELARLDRSDSIGSCHSIESEHTVEGDTSFSGVSSQMSARLKSLVQKFSDRVERFKEKAIQPPTPSSTSSAGKSDALSIVSKEEVVEPAGRQLRLDSYIPVSRASGSQAGHVDSYIGYGKCKIKVPAFLTQCNATGTIDPTSWQYVSWLFFVAVAYLYNAASIPLRAAFKTARFYHPDLVYKNESIQICENIDNITVSCVNETRLIPTYVTRYYPGIVSDENQIYWWIVDYISDFLYLIDVLFIKNRIRFVNDGLFEKDWKACVKHYIAKIDFKLDLLSLVPLDLLYFWPAIQYSPVVRWPRLLKIRTFWEFYDRVDHMVKSAHFIRVARTMTYMMYLIHLEACGYYAMSAYEGFGKNGWVYSGEGIAYVRCMYLATKTATSIGNNPKPVNTLEYIFMTFYWLSGVFVFAMLIGQIRDIFQAAGLAQETYRKTMDQTLSYLKSLNLPREIQDKVRMWFTYNWETSKTLDENSLLDPLPKKMRADLAIHVHYKTLSKVALFQNTDKNLLFDLVLKLKPCLYLPGDYICRKGEIGTEMYIVMSGQVEVVGGENNSIVFATLHEGSVFGEISLLALAGGNRRTADVRSKGYSQLFILSKNDFEEAMREYPEAAKILKRRAKKLLAQNAKHTKKTEGDKMEAEEVIKPKQDTPKLLKTVIQVVDPDSNIHKYLKSRASIHGATCRTPDKASSHDDEDKDGFDNEMDPEILEDDELLVVEQIERRLTPEEIKQLEEEGNADLWPEKCEVDDNKFCYSPTKDMHSPTDTAPDVDKADEDATNLDRPTEKRNICTSKVITICNNKVTPALLTYEDDRPATPPTKQMSADVVTAGSKDAKEAINRQMSSVAKSVAGSARMRSNKVGPASCELVTCQAEIHNCKPTVIDVGMTDVTAATAGDVTQVTNSCANLDGTEKNDETKV